MVKIEVISREMVKPSLPTPPEKSSLKLSIMDELNYVTATPLTLFYPAPVDGQPHVAGKRSHLLKSALADALALYYPYAGELRARDTIECNDAGIEFVECIVDGTLVDVVFRCPDLDLLDSFLSINDLNSESIVGGRIKTLAFACGGLAVAISPNHKVGDGISMLAFVRAWVAAAVAKETSTSIPSEHYPEFASDTIVAASSDVDVSLPRLPPARLDHIRTTTRRFVVGPDAIKRLQARCASNAVKHPTRSEALTAIIWRSLMKTNQAKCFAAGICDHKEKSLLVNATNWRQQLDPPLPSTLVGNLTGKFVCQVERGSDKDLKALVAHLRAGLEASGKPLMNGNKLAEEEVKRLIEFVSEFRELDSRDDVDIYSFISLLSFPLYEFDFGWGKPTWLAFTNLIIKNYVILIDDLDRKWVEILVSTEEDDARMLENDKELLEFATLNPPVVRGLLASSILQSRI